MVQEPGAFHAQVHNHRGLLVRTADVGLLHDELLAHLAAELLGERARDAVQRGLADFKGVGRRFQRYGELPAKDGGQFTLIDDYGHHPVEMAAVLAAARGAFPGRRIVLAFQPHRYTRTRDCFEDFVKVMGTADAVLLAEVYAAADAFLQGSL